MDDFTCFGCCHQEVGLSAEEGRDLNDVGDFCNFGCLAGFVDVGDDGDSKGFFYLFQDAVLVFEWMVGGEVSWWEVEREE